MAWWAILLLGIAGGVLGFFGLRNPDVLTWLIGIGELAYRRNDGVYVVPLGCLKD